MLQKISSVFVVYRCKTLTGSPDPTHANGTDKPCIMFKGGNKKISLMKHFPKQRGLNDTNTKQNG